MNITYTVYVAKFISSYIIRLEIYFKVFIFVFHLSFSYKKENEYFFIYLYYFLSVC